MKVDFSITWTNQHTKQTARPIKRVKFLLEDHHALYHNYMTLIKSTKNLFHKVKFISPKGSPNEKYPYYAESNYVTMKKQKCMGDDGYQIINLFFFIDHKKTKQTKTE